MSVEAVYNYLNWLEKAVMIYHCQRHDLQGKSVLKTQEKFYLADASLIILYHGLLSEVHCRYAGEHCVYDL